METSPHRPPHPPATPTGATSPSTSRRTVVVPTRLGRLAARVVPALGSDGPADAPADATADAPSDALPAAPPVVAWHSMFVDSHSWDRLLPHLTHRELWLLDAPSCGASDPLPHVTDIEGCAGAAADVVEHVQRQAGPPASGGVDWLGNAWGGHVGLALAATRPDLVRSLVAMSAPVHPIDPAVRRRIHLLLPLYRAVGARGPVRRAIEQTLLTDATRRDDPDAVEVLRRASRTAGRRTVGAVRTAILGRTDLGWAADRVRCPTLFVTTDDRGEWTAAQAQAVADRMPDARVVDVHAARVIPALEQPEATAAAVCAFWDRL